MKKKSIRVLVIAAGMPLILYLLFSPSLLRAEVSGPLLDPDSPPGRIIDIGTHHLHLHCIGENQPTVIIDSGMGGFSLEWLEIQHNLATQMRICSYDRAGYGWSESGPAPRTTGQIVDELYWLLSMADEQGPFILVGHSFGGYTMQRFAAIYPELTAAIVLVDSSHPEQHLVFPVRVVTERENQGIPPRQARLMRRRIFMSSLTLPRNFPQQTADLARHLMMFSKSMHAQQQEMQHFRESARDVIDAGAMPDVELVVLSRGLNAWPESPEGERKERIWRSLQQRFLHDRHHARQIIATDSRHHIHLDQPQLLEGVIRGLVVSVCAEQKLAAAGAGVNGVGEC